MEQLTVPGNLDSLVAIREFVKRAATAASLETKKSYRLQLAVDEIATNIITHGYDESGRTGDVLLRSFVDQGKLSIVIEDYGAEYDPDQEDDEGEEIVDMPLEDRPIGGLGIYLTTRNVDEFHYERDGELNRHTFVVFLAAPEA
jgi:serine/threonine-protein kinase RsbW